MNKDEIKKLEMQVGLLEHQAVLLFENFADGKIDKDIYISSKEANRVELENTNIHIESLNAQFVAFEVEAEIEKADEPILQGILCANDVTEEVLSLIERVIVFDEKHVEIRFAFANATSMLVQSEVGMVI